ncbi:MAG: 3-deoxy-8-phosphooctulonate synthase [Rhodospirillaceae bacterium]|nr:3-deoxy-8-phosphooctulonate synthase [Rhodospirillaceae bacterium]|tara:strand:- start:439 stop:1284 length:846 start_codon:yes stop_codon:yes gene_type:complete
MERKLRHVPVGRLLIGNDRPFVLISGPCQLESREHALDVAEILVNICQKLRIELIFKSSFDKANRTSISSQRGVGLDKGLSILEEIKCRFDCPVLTDVHESSQCKVVSEIVDVIQIPAFLCRQTDLIITAGETGKTINVKKGQFLAPWDISNIVEKLESVGNSNILLTERGTSFGYNNLVCDMRSLPQMAATGCPVVFDATHSVQQPGGLGKESGGDRMFASLLARSAVAVGVAAVFIETHQDPDNAPSDGPNMINLKDMPRLLSVLKKLDSIAKSHALDF